MNLKKYIPSVSVAALGAVGFYLRSEEIALARDPISGLYESGHIMSVLSIILGLAACAAALIAAHAAKNVGDGVNERGLSWHMPEFVMCLLASVGLFVGAYMYHSGLWYSTFELPWLEKLFVLMAAAAAAAYMVMAFAANQPTVKGIAKLFSCIPPLFMCVWLLFYYRVNAVNPALQDFVPECLALASGAVGTFGFAGFFYGVGKTGRTLWPLLIAEYFTFVSLAGQTHIDTVLILVGTAIVMFAMSAAVYGGAEIRVEE